ncbi:MAG TPA: hypothetical protein VLE97_11540 [Gaiellaceae bacterium]|nr:hypothetical protein [Gaiellaceae bacterium]
MAKRTTPTRDQLLWLREQASDELRALPIGPARVGERARWLNAAFQCAGVALGERRAQPGSSRAEAADLCARIIEGEAVPVDELRRATTPKSRRQLEAEIARALQPKGSR